MDTATYEIFKSLLYALMFLLLYEYLWKNTIAFIKYRFLRGYYIVCTQKGAPFYYSPDGTPNCLEIKTKWIMPNVIITNSKDYDKWTFHGWKTWTGKINLDSDSKGHGIGY
jgi:hypothetical protein